MTVNDKNHLMYVGAGSSSSIAELDLSNHRHATLVQQLVDGTSALQVDPETNILYAVAEGIQSLFVIDIAQAALVKTIDLQSPPGAVYGKFLVLDQADAKMYVGDGTSLATLDTKTNEIQSNYSYNSTAGLAYDANRKRLYVLDGSGLAAVDATKLAAPNLPGTGGPPGGVGSHVGWLALGAALALAGGAVLTRAMRRAG